MIYVPKVAHTNLSFAYLLKLFSPEKSIGHRQHPCLELSFPVDTTCTSPLHLCEKVFFIGNPRVIHIDSPHHHWGSLWSQNRGLRRGVFFGFSLGLFPCVSAGWWKFSVSLICGQSIYSYPYIERWFVFFQSSFRTFLVASNGCWYCQVHVLGFSLIRNYRRDYMCFASIFFLGGGMGLQFIVLTLYQLFIMNNNILWHITLIP